MPDLKTELAKVVAPPPPPPPPPAQKEQRLTSHPGTTKIMRTRATCSPVFVAKLAKRVGPVKAARMIGYSDNAVGKAIGDDSISLTAELLAKALLEQMEAKEKAELPKAPRANHTILIMRVPDDKVGAVQTVLNAMGVRPSTCVSAVSQRVLDAIIEADEESL